MPTSMKPRNSRFKCKGPKKRRLSDLSGPTRDKLEWLTLAGNLLSRSPSSANAQLREVALKSLEESSKYPNSRVGKLALQILAKLKENGKI